VDYPHLYLICIYIDRIVKDWKQAASNGIQLTKTTAIQTILYPDDKILITKSEDELQFATHQLNKIARKYGMKISTLKSKTMGMCGKNIQREKTEIEGKIIEIEGNILEQVSDFTYLGNTFSEHKKDIDIKLQKYNKINGIIRRHFSKQMTVETKLCLHNITSKSALSYGSEIWIFKTRDTGKLEAAQMLFFMPLLGFTRLDHQRNADFRENFKF
jgi:hypothetical protein